ncbi:MAG: anthranilate synthase component I family protein [bacterium]|nr:anthranilate synthase component I family protein [bacterium]
MKEEKIIPNYKMGCSLIKEDFDIIPLYATFKSPDKNPLNLFKKYAFDEPYAFFLDSGKGPKEIANYSFMGKNPELIFKGKEDSIEIIKRDTIKKYKGNIVVELQNIIESKKIAKIEGLPSFSAGGVGYFSYEVAYLFEELPNLSCDDLSLPEIFFLFTNELIVYEHSKELIYIIININKDSFSLNSYNEAKSRIKEIYNLLSCAEIKQYKKTDTFTDETNLKSNFSKDNFEKIVEKAKEYIKEGDIFQVNLSQRFESKIYEHPLKIYEILRNINPAPFASYLSLGNLKIISSSPERLVNVFKNKIQTRPIAGTRPRGKTISEDSNLAEELSLDAKERAEHIMLVDLERNDLGRICEYGSVFVDELMILEKYSHVIHIVSNVVGKLKKGVKLFDILRATFPGGTITGTPKIRAMEIIEELEPVKRGPYTGSIGCLGYNGYIDLNIIIRTIIIKNDTAYFQVGAGIVADSNPMREYHETLHKAEALIKTLSLVAKINESCIV